MKIHTVAIMLMLLLTSACGHQEFDTAYSAVNLGTPTDLDSDF